jgi:hypothetical protein
MRKTRRYRQLGRLRRRDYGTQMNIKKIDLKFMGPCIANIFQYISNIMQLYTGYLYMESAVHVSGGTSTHHQERIQM